MVVKNKQSGFTIVELLIVIVVIGILAAISIVAYSGIQQRARDAVRINDISQLQRAIEMYKLEDSTDMYPSVGTDGIGYSLNNLLPYVSKYMPIMPVDSNSPTPYQYVRGSGGKSYGIRMSYESKPACTLNTNSTIGWWSLPVC